MPLDVVGSSKLPSTREHLIAAAGDDAAFDAQMADFDPRDEVEEEFEVDPAAADVVALAPTVPREPTRDERDNHSATGHAVFAPWCEYCIAGRGREAGHYRQDAVENDWP